MICHVCKHCLCTGPERESQLVCSTTGTLDILSHKRGQRVTEKGSVCMCVKEGSQDMAESVGVPAGRCSGSSCSVPARCSALYWERWTSRCEASSTSPACSHCHCCHRRRFRLPRLRPTQSSSSSTTFSPNAPLFFLPLRLSASLLAGVSSPSFVLVSKETEPFPPVEERMKFPPPKKKIKKTPDNRTDTWEKEETKIN